MFREDVEFESVPVGRMLEVVDVELVSVVGVSFVFPPVAVVVAAAFVVVPVAVPSSLPFAVALVRLAVVSAAGCDVVAAGLSVVVAASARNRKRGSIRPAVATFEQRRRQATAFRRGLLSRMVVRVV